MKKAFTLVEMLIVVVVLVTLMSIAFRLSSIGDTQTRKNLTVSRMQRLENCLSGYYAAFGTYPPVKLHGSRNYNLKTNSHGMQKDEERQLALNWYKTTGDHGISSTQAQEDWRQIRAACMAQPLAARFPYPEGYNDVVVAKSEIARERLQSGEDTNTDAEYRAMVSAGYDDGYTKNPGRHDLSEEDWQESQLFEFGVMSYLLPRYLVMMNGDARFFTQCKQWTSNNEVPANPLNGEIFSSWTQVRSAVTEGRQNNKRKLAQVANIPSQAVCARWLPNLENMCYTGSMSHKLYGVEIYDSDQRLDDIYSVFAPGGSGSSGTSGQYVLSVVTITDGWHNEFYYYSPPPYQSYVVWSAGENGKTFPPWVDRSGSEFTPMKNQCIGVLIEDDIIHLSH